MDRISEVLALQELPRDDGTGLAEAGANDGEALSNLSVLDCEGGGGGASTASLLLCG